MFDIGFTELLLVLSIGLLVLGPERLPGMIKTISYWSRKARVGVEEVKQQISKELQVDEIEKNIGNYKKHLKGVKQTIENSTDIDAINESIGSAFSSTIQETKAAVTKTQTANTKTATQTTTAKVSGEKKVKRTSKQASTKKTTSASKARKTIASRSAQKKSTATNTTAK